MPTRGWLSRLQKLIVNTCYYNFKKFQLGKTQLVDPVKEPEIEDFNTRVVICAAFVSVWFGVRGLVLGAPTSSTVLIEWLAFLVFSLWVIVQPLPSMRGGLMSSAVTVFSSVFFVASVWRQENLGQYSMYWRGFGPRIAIISLTGALVVSFAPLWKSTVPQSYELRRALTIAGRIVAGLAIFWMLPSVLQPMDGWLNIGDATEKVLDEIAGPIVGNIPGYNSASGYSTLLGVPLAPLYFVAGRAQEKFVLLVLWVNALMVAVPVLIAGILRRVNRDMPYLLCLVIGFVAITISGDFFGNQPTPFDNNTSLFRELSFLARGFLPLLVGFLVTSLFRGGMPATRRVVFLGGVATLTAINNPEFGVPSVLAVFVLTLIHTSDRTKTIKVAKLYVITVLLCGCLVVVPGAISGGAWISNRLGVFMAVISGESATISVGASRNIPALGIIALTYSIAVVSVAFAVRQLRNRNSRMFEPAASVALYFGLWVLFSAPYVLNAGGKGAFGAQFHMIPLVILAASLYQLTKFADRDVGSARLISRIPLNFVVVLAIVAGIQAPYSLTEWRRVQAPVSDEKWTDEWSTEKLDWIHPSKVVALANTVGGVSKVGWWYSHGNAIELLTDIENLLGTSGFEGAVRSKALRNQACEPVTRSSLRYVIIDKRFVPILEDCADIQVAQVSSANTDGLVLVTLSRQ